jgi:hypothetical protein
MILPTKHIRLQYSLLNLSSILLNNITPDQTVTLLWEKAQKIPETRTFERFVLALDLLFILGLIDFINGFIVRLKK